MKNIKIIEFFYYPILLFLILFSFFNFSERYTPELNNYQAIQVLMTPGWSFPGDLYVWGQDFSGSLVPFLSQMLCEFYKFPPILAVSLMHFILLTAGFLALSTFFRSTINKLLLAIVWFFPPWHFIGHIVWVFGIQLSTFVIGLYLLKQFQKDYSKINKGIWLSAGCLAFIVSLWVSDLSAVSVILYCSLFIPPMIKKLRELGTKSSLFKKDYIYIFMIILFWISAGVLFLIYARSRAFKTDAYHHPVFNNPGEFMVGLKAILHAIYNSLTFSTGNFIECLFTWVLIAGIPLTIHFSKGEQNHRNPIRSNPWFAFFFLNAVVTLLVLVASHWVFLNGMDRRYFSLVYMSSWIAFLFYTESGTSKNPVKRNSILFVVAITGALSSFYQFYIPRIVPSRIGILNELQSLGDFGMIASLDNAYAAGCVAPDHIKATPNDKEPVRNFEIVKQTLNQPEIYIAKNGWLKSFPDSINQFGRIFIKLGNSINRAGLDLCRYDLVRIKMTFFPADLKYQGTLIEDQDALRHQSVNISTDFDRNKHFVYGPFITLRKGKYIARFCLKVTNELSTTEIALLDVSANWGKTLISSRSLRPSDFGMKNHYEYFDLPFELKMDSHGMEFRILCFTPNDLSFNHVELTEL